MHDHTSAGPQRPRVRRALGVLVGAALLVTPLAAAPAASAQGALGNVTAPSVGATAQQTAEFYLVQVIQGIIGIVQRGQLLGEGAPVAAGAPCPAPDGLGSSLSCVITALHKLLYPSGRATTNLKSSVRKQIRSARWVTR